MQAPAGFVTPLIFEFRGTLREPSHSGLGLKFPWLIFGPDIDAGDVRAQPIAAQLDDVFESRFVSRWVGVPGRISLDEYSMRLHEAAEITGCIICHSG